jgi:hypothetical protein
MKVYAIEYRAVVTLAELAKAASQTAALPKDNPDLLCLRAVQERNFEPSGEIRAPNRKRDRP